MIVPPKDYIREIINDEVIDKLGGFLLNDIENISPLIKKKADLRNQSIIKNDNIIFKTVNSLSSVSYKINQEVLEFILKRGLDLNLIYNPTQDLNLKPKTVTEKKDLMSLISKIRVEQNILGIASFLKDIPEFYIPVRLDYRGRVYCMTDFLNYQSSELAKSLLLFSKGEKVYKSDLNSIKFLKIFGANCYGNGFDKKSYKDRIN